MDTGKRGKAGLTELMVIIILLLAPNQTKCQSFLATNASILFSSFSRNYQIGKHHSQLSYTMSLTEAVVVSVPVSLAVPGGKWAMYGGNNLQCQGQILFGKGHMAVFTCPQPGTYFAFFKPITVPSFTNQLEEHEVTKSLFLTMQNFVQHQPLLDYQNELRGSDVIYSDPLLLVGTEFCYQWVYRLEEINAVGFIFDEADPAGSDAGSFKVYNLFVWITEPPASSKDEIYNDLIFKPSTYSTTITKRFNELGVTPCLRFVHRSVEVINDANFSNIVYVDSDFSIKNDGTSISNKKDFRPHWVFKLFVFWDRMVSTLGDITFVISAKQNSALYHCFVGDTRVFVPSRRIRFNSRNKQQMKLINLKSSDMSGLRRTLLLENGLFFYGYLVNYTGHPWNRGRDLSFFRTDVKIFGNACVSQELVLTYQESAFLTMDWLKHIELLPIILPALDETELILDEDQLDRVEFKDQDRNLALRKTDPGIMGIMDFAFTPTHMILLRNDSVFYLHPSATVLKGIGFNTVSRKLRLGAVVRRTWCAMTSTPKIHNQIVPAFSKEGNIIILFPVPIEGSQGINQDPLESSCTTVKVQGTAGQNSTSLGQTEEEIHEHDEKVKMDAIILERRETQSAVDNRIEQEERRRNEESRIEDEDLDTVRTFWFAGTHRLPASDPHFARGLTDPANVKLGTNLTLYNKNIIFIIERDFEFIRFRLTRRGFNFNIAEHIERTSPESGDKPTLTRDASNNRLFAIHALEFSAVEKTFLVAVEFQSMEFKRNEIENGTIFNDLTITVMTVTAVDFPSDIRPGVEREVYLQNIEIHFSGSLLLRPNLDSSASPDPSYDVSLSDWEDKDNLKLNPKPMAKRISTMRTINTAIPIYIIRLGDISVYASLDGSFARPITYYWDHNPGPGNDTSSDTERRVKPLVRIPESDYDTLVTEKGIISILTRHNATSETFSNNSQRAVIGSLLTNEPLRTVTPFLQGIVYFQAVVPEGEIVYGQVTVDLHTSKLRNPPFTTFIEIPFWSLLQGSKSLTFADNTFVETPPVDNSLTAEGVEVNFDRICPFASFTLEFVQFPFIEAGYRTRITAEIAYYGDTVPLEADLLIEFTEVQGLSIVISSSLDIVNDQTIILKSIDIQSFMTEPTIDEMYKYFLTHQDEEPIPEFTRVFTMTIRPSVLNLHCNKDDYFKTIQMNVGCVPSTRMRLIGESLPLEKIRFLLDENESVSQQDRETKWFWDPVTKTITIPRDDVHFDQRNMFGCQNIEDKVCTIQSPFAELIQDNFYLMSFRDEMVPKFEQFLTRHVRRVTGNVIMYDVLGSYTFDDEKSVRLGRPINNDGDKNTRLAVNTTQWEAKCIVDDANWYGRLSKLASPASSPQLHLSSDIYQHFNQCFSQSLSVASPNKLLLDREEPLKLSQISYWVFNETNRNAISLPRKRNWIFIIRAVVINTKYNPFTYCQRLETFFALRVHNVKPQREPLVWYIYLSITIFVLLCIVLTYIYFSRYYIWRTDVNTSDRNPHKKQVENFNERSKLPVNDLGRNKNPFKALVRKVLLLARWKDLHQKDILGKKTPTRKETAMDSGIVKAFRRLTVQLKPVPLPKSVPGAKSPTATKLAPATKLPKASSGPKPPAPPKTAPVPVLPKNK